MNNNSADNNKTIESIDLLNDIKSDNFKKMKDEFPVIFIDTPSAIKENLEKAMKAAEECKIYATSKGVSIPEETFKALVDELEDAINTRDTVKESFFAIVDAYYKENILKKDDIGDRKEQEKKDGEKDLSSDKLRKDFLESL